MGLFNKEEPPKKVEKTACDGCGKMFSEDDLNSDNLCTDCENKEQCTDCEKWFDELDDNTRCKACAEKAESEAGEEEEDCASCEKTFKHKQLTERDDEWLCEKCLKEKDENTSASLYVRTGLVSPAWKVEGPRTYIEKIYDELVAAKKENKEFIEIKFGLEDDKLADKTFMRLADVIRIDVSYTTTQWDEESDYPVTNYDSGNEVE